ncbi:hypothetical protein B0H21DRAFT_844597 [Amylocystis lapponica]|nr:hypothetical protein B0H21DRAFT_844597 [Amylocystis lapponica]
MSGEFQSEWTRAEDVAHRKRVKQTQRLVNKVRSTQEFTLHWYGQLMKDLELGGTSTTIDVYYLRLRQWDQTEVHHSHKMNPNDHIILRHKGVTHCPDIDAVNHRASGIPAEEAATAVPRSTQPLPRSSPVIKHEVINLSLLSLSSTSSSPKKRKRAPSVYYHTPWSNLFEHPSDKEKMSSKAEEKWPGNHMLWISQPLCSMDHARGTLKWLRAATCTATNLERKTAAIMFGIGGHKSLLPATVLMSSCGDWIIMPAVVISYTTCTTHRLGTATCPSTCRPRPGCRMGVRQCVERRGAAQARTQMMRTAAQPARQPSCAERCRMLRNMLDLSSAWAAFSELGSKDGDEHKPSSMISACRSVRFNLAFGLGPSTNLKSGRVRRRAGKRRDLNIQRNVLHVSWYAKPPQTSYLRLLLRMRVVGAGVMVQRADVFLTIGVVGTEDACFACFGAGDAAEAFFAALDWRREAFVAAGPLPLRLPGRWASCQGRGQPWAGLSWPRSRERGRAGLAGSPSLLHAPLGRARGGGQRVAPEEVLLALEQRLAHEAALVSATGHCAPCEREVTNPGCGMSLMGVKTLRTGENKGRREGGGGDGEGNRETMRDGPADMIGHRAPVLHRGPLCWGGGARELVEAHPAHVVRLQGITGCGAGSPA